MLTTPGKTSNAAAESASETHGSALDHYDIAILGVLACNYISDAGAFELHVVCADLDAYSRWSMDTLFKLPNVKDIHTSFSLGEVKSGAALPLGHLRG